MRATFIVKVFAIGLQYGATLFRPMPHGSQTGVGLIVCGEVKNRLPSDIGLKNVASSKNPPSYSMPMPMRVALIKLYLLLHKL